VVTVLAFHRMSFQSSLIRYDATPSPDRSFRFRNSRARSELQDKIMSNALYAATLLALLLAVAPLAFTGLFWLTARLLGANQPGVRTAMRTMTVLAMFCAVEACAKASSSKLTVGLLDLVALAGFILGFRRTAKLSRMRTAVAIVAFFATSLALNAIFAYFVLRPTIAETFRAGSDNMFPTLREGEGLLVDRTLTPDRWDIVTLRSPMDPGVTLVMRLIGLPGETIELRGGEVVRNGAIMPKPSGLSTLHYSNRPIDGRCNGCDGNRIVLGANEYYLLADNSRNSIDSRSFPPRNGHGAGAVPLQDIIGVARIRYGWADRIGFLR
jgi:signal peptidase I